MMLLLLHLDIQNSIIHAIDEITNPVNTII